MSTSNESAKLSLVNLITGICFFAAVTPGAVEGLKVGLIGVLAGLFLGLLLGVLSAVGNHLSACYFVDHWLPDETQSSVWNWIAVACFLIGELAWLVGTTFLASQLCRFVVQWFA